VIILWYCDGSAPRPNVENEKFSMRVENLIKTSHWKLLISDIRPRPTSAALAAHLWAAAYRLGSTGLVQSATSMALRL